MRARSGQCISVNEVAQLLSREFGTPMAAARGGRRIVNGEFHTVHFVEDVKLPGALQVAKLTKEQENVSGDNYICRQEEAGRFVMCLSDGMGSGVEACRESEGSGRTSGTVSGIRLFPGDCCENGELCSCDEGTGRDFFNSGHLRSGSVHRNLQFPEGRCLRHLYQKGITGWKPSLLRVWQQG